MKGHRFIILLAASLIGCSSAPKLRPFLGSYVRHLDANSVLEAHLDEPIVAIEAKKIAYPEELRGSRVVGHVLMEVYIDEEGHAIEVEALEGEDLVFARVAEDSVRNWRFTPPRKGGRPVRSFAEFRVTISET